MDQIFLTIGWLKESFLGGTKRNERYSINVDHNIIIVLFQIKGWDLWLPKLEWLMPIKRHRFHSWYIYNKYIVSVFIDRLVADNEFFEALFCVSDDCDISIWDVKLCLVLNEKIKLFWIELVEFYKEHSALSLVLVGKQVENFSLSVVDDLLDEWDIVKLIDIYPRFVRHIEIYTILNWSNDCNLLVVAHQEVIRLSCQWHIEECKLRDSLLPNVEPHDSILTCKQQMGNLSIILCILKLKLHGYFFKCRVVHDLNFLDGLKLVHRFFRCVQIFLTFENEYLIRLIFIHDQFFSRNDCQNVFFRGNLHWDNFVCFSWSRFKQRYLNLTLFDLLKSVYVKEFYLVFDSYQESFHSFNWKTFGSIKIFLNHIDSKIMDIFSSIYIKIAFILLISDSIFAQSTEHHSRAVHEIVHYISDYRLECVFINSVKVNFCVSYNLYPPSSFNEENISSEI